MPNDIGKLTNDQRNGAIAEFVRIVIEELRRASGDRYADQKHCDWPDSTLNPENNTKVGYGIGYSYLGVSENMLKKIEERVEARMKVLEDDTPTSPADLGMDKLLNEFAKATQAAKEDSRKRGLPVSGR